MNVQRIECRGANGTYTVELPDCLDSVTITAPPNPLRLVEHTSTPEVGYWNHVLKYAGDSRSLFGKLTDCYNCYNDQEFRGIKPGYGLLEGAEGDRYGLTIFIRESERPWSGWSFFGRKKKSADFSFLPDFPRWQDYTRLEVPEGYTLQGIYPDVVDVTNRTDERKKYLVTPAAINNGRVALQKCCG